MYGAGCAAGISSTQDHTPAAICASASTMVVATVSCSLGIAGECKVSTSTDVPPVQPALLEPGRLAVCNLVATFADNVYDVFRGRRRCCERYQQCR